MYCAKFYSQKKKKKKSKPKPNQRERILQTRRNFIQAKKKKKKKKETQKVEKDKKLAIGWRRVTWRYVVCKYKGICVIYYPHHIFSLVFLPNFVGLERKFFAPFSFLLVFSLEPNKDFLSYFPLLFYLPCFHPNQTEPKCIYV